MQNDKLADFLIIKKAAEDLCEFGLKKDEDEDVVELEDQFFRCDDKNNDHRYYADLNAFSPQLTYDKKTLIPQIVLDHLNKSPDAFTKRGLLTEINCAWLSINSDLFLWNYSTSNEFHHYKNIDRVVQAVALVTPREKNFKNIVKYIIAVSTTVEVTLLALSWSTNQNMIIQPTRYSIQTEGKIMTHLIGSRSGRIFMGGNDGNIHEFQYSNDHESWRAWMVDLNIMPPFKAAKINRGPPTLANLVPQFLRSKIGWKEEIVNMSIDDARGVLYAATSAGSLLAFYIGALNNAHLHSSTSIAGLFDSVGLGLGMNDSLDEPCVCISSDFFGTMRVLKIINMAATWIRSLKESTSEMLAKGIPRADWLERSHLVAGGTEEAENKRKEKAKVVGLHVIPIEESEGIHLCVVLGSGLRIYLSLINDEGRNVRTRIDGRGMPRGLKVVHVRSPIDSTQLNKIYLHQQGIGVDIGGQGQASLGQDQGRHSRSSSRRSPLSPSTSSHSPYSQYQHQHSQRDRDRDRDGMSDIEAIQNLARPCEFSTLSSSQPPDTLVKQSFYRGGVCLQVMDPLIDLLSSSSGSSSTSRSGLTNLNTTDRSKKDSRVLSLCEDLQAHPSTRNSNIYNDNYSPNDSYRRISNNADGYSGYGVGSRSHLANGTSVVGTQEGSIGEGSVRGPVAPRAGMREHALFLNTTRDIGAGTILSPNRAVSALRPSGLGRIYDIQESSFKYIEDAGSSRLAKFFISSKTPSNIDGQLDALQRSKSTGTANYNSNRDRSISTGRDTLSRGHSSSSSSSSSSNRSSNRSSSKDNSSNNSHMSSSKIRSEKETPQKQISNGLGVVAPSPLQIALIGNRKRRDEDTTSSYGYTKDSSNSSGNTNNVTEEWADHHSEFQYYECNIVGGGLPYQGRPSAAGITKNDLPHLTWGSEFMKQCIPTEQYPISTGTQRNIVLFGEDGVYIFKKLRPIDVLYDKISMNSQNDTYINEVFDFANRFGTLETCAMCVGIACNVPCDLDTHSAPSDSTKKRAIIAMQHIHTECMKQKGMDPPFKTWQVSAYVLMASRILRPIFFRKPILSAKPLKLLLSRTELDSLRFPLQELLYVLRRFHRNAINGIGSRLPTATSTVKSITKASYAANDELHKLCSKGDYEAVINMLQTDTSALNTRDQEGRTPLHRACEKGNYSLAKKLIEFGADPNMVDSHKKTPLEISIHEVQNGNIKMNQDLIALLVTSGGAGQQDGGMRAAYLNDGQRKALLAQQLDRMQGVVSRSAALQEENEALNHLYRLVSRSLQLINLLYLLIDFRFRKGIPVDFHDIENVTFIHLVIDSNIHNKIADMINKILKMNIADTIHRSFIDELTSNCFMYYSVGDRLADEGRKEISRALNDVLDHDDRNINLREGTKKILKATQYWRCLSKVQGAASELQLVTDQLSQISTNDSSLSGELIADVVMATARKFLSPTQMKDIETLLDIRSDSSSTTDNYSSYGVINDTTDNLRNSGADWTERLYHGGSVRDSVEKNEFLKGCYHCLLMHMKAALNERIHTSTFNSTNNMHNNGNKRGSISGTHVPLGMAALNVHTKEDRFSTMLNRAITLNRTDPLFHSMLNDFLYDNARDVLLRLRTAFVSEYLKTKNTELQEIASSSSSSTTTTSVMNVTNNNSDLNINNTESEIYYSHLLHQGQYLEAMRYEEDCAFAANLELSSRITHLQKALSAANMGVDSISDDFNNNTYNNITMMNDISKSRVPYDALRQIEERVRHIELQEELKREVDTLGPSMSHFTLRLNYEVLSLQSMMEICMKCQPKLYKFCLRAISIGAEKVPDSFIKDYWAAIIFRLVPTANGDIQINNEIEALRRQYSSNDNFLINADGYNFQHNLWRFNVRNEVINTLQMILRGKYYNDALPLSHIIEILEKLSLLDLSDDSLNYSWAIDCFLASQTIVGHRFLLESYENLFSKHFRDTQPSQTILTFRLLKSIYEILKSWLNQLLEYGFMDFDDRKASEMRYLSIMCKNNDMIKKLDGWRGRIEELALRVGRNSSHSNNRNSNGGRDSIVLSLLPIDDLRNADVEVMNKISLINR